MVIIIVFLINIINHQYFQHILDHENHLTWGGIEGATGM